MADKIGVPKIRGNGAEIPCGDNLLSLQIYSPRIIRVRLIPPDAAPIESLSVIASARKTKWTSESSRSQFVIRLADFSLSVNRRTGAITFRDQNGDTLLRDRPDWRKLESVNVSGENTRSATAGFIWSKGETLHGLGQHQDGVVNWRGKQLTMVQVNMDVSLPVLVSSRGWGLLWDNPSETRFDGRDKPNAPTLWSQVAPGGMDYYFIYGPNPDQIISEYRELTGRAPLYPRWSYGLFHSKERYARQDELLDTAHKCRQLGFPMDCIVQDWRYWDPHPFGSHRFDADRFPDPAGMIRQLHEKLRCRFMISVWPKFESRGENFRMMHKKGFLYEPHEFCDENSHNPRGEAYYDTFNPDARELYWTQIKNHLATKGVDGWWMDGTEPELFYLWSLEKRKNLRTAMGPMSRVLNAYPLAATRAVYDGLKEWSDRRPYILTRSAWAGQQRHAATTWSGDIVGSWETFRKQVIAGMHFCICGIPYWTTDIGGFFICRPDEPDPFPGGCDNPKYRELFVRWFQFGAFCPIFRIHGALASTPREPWRYGSPTSETYRALLSAARLRYRLMPYIYSLGWGVYSRHETIMRSLLFDFRTDRIARQVGDQFMFGPGLMFCPVTAPGARRRKTYLPKTAGGWFDCWTGRNYAGGQTINSPAPLLRSPLYARAGAIIPLGPFADSTDAIPPDAPLDILIYPGADGQFELYEDAGDGLEYEKGQHSIIPLQWDNRSGTLLVGQRKGNWHGMPRRRVFRVIIAASGNGIENPSGGKTFNYDGGKIRIHPTKKSR